MIPAYNAESFIEEAIMSCLLQSYRPLEIIVVDDGSTDATAAKVQSIAHEGLRDARVVLHGLPRNTGAGNALHQGFSKAKGDFVCWLSADDAFVDRLKTERQVEVMVRESADWSTYSDYYSGMRVSSAHLVRGKYTSRTALADPILDQLFMRDPDYRLLLLLFGNPLNGSSVMIRNESIRRFGQFDPATRNVDGDGDLWMRFSALRLSFSLLRGAPVFYREHGAQTSKRRREMAYGLELTRVRMVEALNHHGMLTALLRKTAPLFLFALIGGGYREKPLVTEYLLSHVSANERLFSWPMVKIAKGYLGRARGSPGYRSIDAVEFRADLATLKKSEVFLSFESALEANRHWKKLSS